MRLVGGFLRFDHLCMVAHPQQYLHPPPVSWHACTVKARPDTLHHENYLRSREVEYLLRINMTYRNSRLWMASSYRRRTAYFDVVFMLRMLALALLMCGFSFYRPQDLARCRAVA